MRVFLSLLALFLSFSGAFAQEDLSAPNSETNSLPQVEPTIRIPQNIRVLLTDGSIVVVPLETYVARSLAQEWFSSWGNYDGGMNALKAGAVVIRSYAISFINNASADSDYDICATTACQVYRETTTPNAQKAAEETAGYVLCTSSHTVARSEYSAENNSRGFGCGDGFTQPSGGCIEDPICAGEKRFGHGRGMCQWGSAKWATGLKMAGNGGTNYPANADSGIMHGYPRKDWVEIVNHYYPKLALIKAVPLEMGDPVKLIGAVERTNYNCVEAGIECGETFVKDVGAKGTLVKGPVQVSSDGKNFTWWRVAWEDQSSGWIQENWLERAIPEPNAPVDLQAKLVSGNKIELTWQPPAGSPLGFKIERSINSPSNWVQIKELPANSNTFSDQEVLPGSKNYYRIRAFNAVVDSDFTETEGIAVPDSPPVLTDISPIQVQLGMPIIVTNTAVVADVVFPVTDFENCANGALAMFRPPAVSPTTTPFLGSTPNVAAVTGRFPSHRGGGSRAMNLKWSFKAGTKNPWVRLTTGGNGKLSNPVIDLKKTLQFDIHTDKALKIALGCRETVTPAGTPVGSEGGQIGTIEFVGAASKISGERPEATYTVKPNMWTTVNFDFSSAPVAGLTGDGVLSTKSGLAVLESLALVPDGELGAYNVYLDNFRVVHTKKLRFSLEPDAPVGASIDPETGVFTWIPTDEHKEGDYPITVRVTDDGVPAQCDTKTFTVSVVEDPDPPRP